MRDLAESVRELCKKADHLAQRSNELSDLIEGLNTALSAADIGVAVWVPDVFYSEVGTAYQLGWARVGRDWQIALGELDPSEESDPLRSMTTMSLLNARQDLRIFASSFLHHLIKQLYEIVEQRCEGLKGIEADLDALPLEWRNRSTIPF
jgi:hypothetical protein